jgi:1-deoxy-D-xylulose-5-phosphate reductoisomerase
VHSFVEFVDGSVIAQLGPPDMRTPIQYALTHPDRVEGCAPTLDWSALGSLDFEPVDHACFPALRLADEVMRRGPSAGAVFNAANEVAVAAFLAGRMPFPRITTLVAEAVAGVDTMTIAALEDVIRADAAGRAFAEEALAASGSTPDGARATA